MADLSIPGPIKGITAVMAALLLGAGGWTAFDQGDARALLLAGSVLVALAFFGDRITELVAKVGDKELALRAQANEVALKRATVGVDRVSEEMAALTDDPDMDANLKSRLEELETELELVHAEAERAIKAAGDPSRPPVGPSEVLAALAPLASAEYAAVSFPTPAGRLLVMRAALEKEPWPELRCVVVGPDGWQHETTVKPEPLFGKPVYQAEFPSEFTRRGHIQKGAPGHLHHVAWLRGERRLVQDTFMGNGVSATPAG